MLFWKKSKERSEMGEFKKISINDVEWNLRLQKLNHVFVRIIVVIKIKRK